MNLTLQVTGPEAAKLGAAARKVFSEAGGTIGRLRNNYWVLSNPWVSSHHAVIRFVGGVFYIEDTSTNGVFLNSPENRLTPGQPHPITSGDRIFIDPYQIEVVIAAGAEQVVDPVDPFGLQPAPASRPAGATEAPAVPYASILPSDQSGEGDNWLDRLAPDAPPSALPGPRAAELSGGSPLLDHYRPPTPIAPAPAPPAEPGQPVIPADWFADTPLPGVPRSPRAAAGPPAAPRVEPAPAPPVSPAPHEARPLADRLSRDARGRDNPPPRAGEDAVRGDRRRPGSAGSGESRDGVSLAAVLEGAGIHGVAVTPELAASFGEILRVVVGGVMDILQARQRIKNEFRMEMTSFKPLQNNPLKFSANVDDALHNLLVKRNPAYLGAVEAFEDAFADLRNHQMAMLAGVRVAFDAMLASFDPDALQERFDREVKKGALINMPGKLRYWDQYCETMRTMVRDSETTFRELFGEEFATAYEEQLARLKGEVRSQKP